MAAVPKSGTPSPSTTSPASESLRTGKKVAVGVTIVAGDACYVDSAGIKLATGAAANAAAVVVGFAAVNAGPGDALTLVANKAMMYYGAGLASGTPYYLSGTVPGGLDTVASTGGTVLVAYAWDATQIICVCNL